MRCPLDNVVCCDYIVYVVITVCHMEFTSNVCPSHITDLLPPFPSSASQTTSPATSANPMKTRTMLVKRYSDFQAFHAALVAAVERVKGAAVGKSAVLDTEC